MAPYAHWLLTTTTANKGATRAIVYKYFQIIPFIFLHFKEIDTPVSKSLYRNNFPLNIHNAGNEAKPL